MTAVYALSVGLVVRRGNRTFEFERRLNTNTILFIDCIDKSPHQWQVSTLYREIQSGKLSVVLGDKVQAPLDQLNGIGTIFDIDSLPDHHRNQVNKYLAYIRALRRLGLTRGMREKINDGILEVAKQLKDACPPSASTIMSKWRKLDKNNNSVVVLVSGHVIKKSPTRKDWQLAVARKAIQSEYCTRKRISVKELQRLVNRQLKTLALQCQKPVEEAKISYTTLRREIQKIDGFALDSSRYGISYAKNKWRFSLSGNGTSRAMQRYEIDHTILDIVVISDTTGMPLGRPTITVVIDTYASYVVGFFISFWGPGLASTFSALKVAFAPKDAYQLSEWKIENPWLGMGVCEMLVMDNGLEFHSPQVRSLAQRLHMDLLFNPVRQPWLKGVVERTLGNLGHHLPSEGRVEKPRNNYLPISPDSTAAITFSSLCQGLAMAFIDVHANTINSRKLARPIDLFGESLEKLPPPMLLGQTDDLDIVMGERATKVIGSEGVIQDYIRYNSPELRQLRTKIGYKFTTEIRYLPESLDRVYVRVPETAHWMVVPSCWPDYTTNLSVVQHKAIRRLAKEELNRRNAEEVLMRCRERLQECWNTSAQVGKRIKSQHLKAMSGLTSAHAIADVFSKAKPDSLVLTAPKAPICEIDMLPPLHEMPTFETINFRRGN